MLARHKLIESGSYIQSEIDFDVYGKNVNVVGTVCRNSDNDSDPPEIQKLSAIAEIRKVLSVLYKRLTANLQAIELIEHLLRQRIHKCLVS